MHVDGLWGSTTAATLPTLGPGSSDPVYNEIAQWDVDFNGFDVPLNTNFDESLRDVVDEFQKVICISNPRIQRQIETITWLALLVSFGNPSRGQDDISSGASIGMDTSSKVDGVAEIFVDDSPWD